jgi:hypothetical protein
MKKRNMINAVLLPNDRSSCNTSRKKMRTKNCMTHFISGMTVSLIDSLSVETTKVYFNFTYKHERIKKWNSFSTDKNTK